MLTGHITYKGYKLNVIGISSDTSLTLYISSGTRDSLHFLGSYAERPFVVSITDLAVSVAVTKGTSENGKKKTLDTVNEDFYKILGGVLKQLKMGYMTGEVYRKERINERIRQIKKFKYKGKTAYLGYELGKLTCIKYKYNDLEIDLLDRNNGVLFTPELKSQYYTGDTKKRIVYTAQVADLLLEGKTFVAPKKQSKKEKGALQGPVTGKDFVNINLFHHTIHDVLRDSSQKEQYAWLLNRRYTIVSDETLENTLSYLSQYQILAVDTETTGLTINHYMHTAPEKADKLVGIVLSGKEGESFYIPLGHESHFPEYDPLVATDPLYDPLVAAPTSIKNVMGGDIPAFFERTRDFFEKKDFVTFNAGFDWRVFYGYHIKLNVVFDVLAAFMLTLTAAEQYNTNNLKVWTKRALDRVSLELDNYSKSGKWTNEMAFSFKDLPYEMVRLYACPDSDNTLGLYNYIVENNIVAEYASHELVKIETDFMVAVGYQEFYGHYIPKEQLEELKRDLEQSGETALENFKLEAEKAGVDTTDLNPNSPPQMMKLFYQDMKIPEQRDSKTGKLTAGRQVLGRLLSKGVAPEAQKYPILAYYFAYKDANKLLSDFTVMLEDPNYDGYLYSRVKQFLNTGRVSVSGPNYQSYSDTAKKYVTGRPGYYIMDYDYSSIESRIIASMSGEPYLLEAFEDIDLDYHKLQAAKLFSKPYELVSSALRKQAKALNFGIPYGLGDKKLGEAIFGKESDANTAEAKRLKDEYFKMQPYVDKYFRDNRAQGVGKRYTNTHYGRRRYYPQDQPNFKVELAAGNQPIQGTAADMFKKAIGKILKYILSNNLEGRILLSAYVHDECVIEIANDINPLDVLSFVKPIVEEPIPSFVPILIGCGFGKSWYNAKSVEIPVLLQSEMLENRDKYFADWPASLSNLTETLQGYIHEHELKRVADFVTTPDNNGNVMKAIINDYFLDKLKSAGLKDNEDEPIEKALGALWAHYDLNRYADFNNVVHVLRPSELASTLASDDVQEIDKFAQSILRMNIMLDTTQGTIYLNKTEETFEAIKSYIKEYAVTDRIGYTLHLAVKEADSTSQNPKVKLGLVNKYRIPLDKVQEFTGKVNAVYRHY